MRLTTENIKDLLKALDFIPINGMYEAYEKKYMQHNGYTVRVDISARRIEYADNSFDDYKRIKVWVETTSNFSQSENMVVLECVDRLLEKGYEPNCIELEKVYPSGHGHSGRLDILVNTPDGQAFLMIDCKIWGKEYEKEQKKMLADGGQLLTYYKNATATKHLCLYASNLVKNKVEYVNSIVDVQDEWASLSETKDIYEHWNKNFKKNGIFEGYASPYNIVHKRLTYGDLENMREEDSRKIYNQIMEILRHNGISDKPNAFNKLLNLFVCKIIDEDRNPDEELQFQCWEGLTDEKLQMTLNDLYKEGMWRFLEIKVIDHSENDVDKVLQELGIGNNAQKQKLMAMFSDTRLKKSPNFAFVEVQDEKTFQLNAKIVREVVELLQQYRFRYDQKHEFLGNFFEKMLNTSMKQEAGQFFTPVPITRFIISSMPLHEFVQRKIDEKNADPLPSVIDYACGSGHFLTEFMSTMQTIIESIDVSKASPRMRGELSSWQGYVKFKWAKEYVYGIDFDNRLVKTTKVSAFFNGDGEANIVWGNGLDSFEHSEEYRDKLKSTLPDDKKENGQFDILISNPPYSVQAFRTMLKYGAESFDLFNSLTDNSSEIECLFVERMKQLLKVGGLAGVILPSSIFTNGGIYSRTREIIFKFFKVKSIVELGSGTFMKTGTNTVILFLERRAKNEHVMIEQAINRFFKDGLDVTVMGIENAYSKFVANVYDDLAFDDYISLVAGEVTDTMKAHELWLDYEKEFGKYIYSSIILEEQRKIENYLIEYVKNNNVKEIKPIDITNIKMKVSKFFIDFEEFSILELDAAISAFVKNEYNDDINFNDYISFLKQNPNEKMLSYRLYFDYISKVCSRCVPLEKEKLMYFLLTYDQNVVVVKSGQKQDEKEFLGYEFSERRGYEGIRLLPGGTKLFDENGDVMNPQKINSYIYNAFLGKTNIQIDEVVAKNVSYGRMSSFFEYGTNKFNRRINLNNKPKIISKYPFYKIENLLVNINGATTKIQQEELLSSGEIPIVTQEEGVLISGYCNGYEPITDIPLIVMGDHTCIFKWVDFNFVRGADNTQLLKFNNTLVMSKYAYYLLNSIDIPNKEKYERHFKYVKELKIPLPPLEIQSQLIAKFEVVEREEIDVKSQLIEIKECIIKIVKNSGGDSEKLSAFSDYVTERIDYTELTAQNYVGVDNLLQGVEGKVDSNYVPTSGKETAYCAGDILLSNIRPYLKKAWLADGDGGCSNDVLAIRVDEKKALPKFVFCHLSSDDFFAYEMEHIGSNVKMPRANKTMVLEYRIPLPSLEKQREIVIDIEKQEAKLTLLRERLDKLKNIKADILNRYL